MKINQGKKKKISIFNQEVKKSQEPGFTDLKESFDIGSQKNQIGYQKEQNYYFDSYSHFSIHEDMLKDLVRTYAYKDAIMQNPHLFKDKIVLDIGSGTGILSIFAVKAGAKHVYAIDNASIAYHCRTILKENNLDDKITVIKGKVEEIDLPVDKVDIIISEWMGYFLLYESMLDTVIFARDKWLKKTGLLFPDRAVIYLAAADDGQYRDDKLRFWEDPYNVDMSNMQNLIIKEPQVDILNADYLISNGTPVLDIDLNTVTVDQLDFSSQFKLKINRNYPFNAIVGWFDCYFEKCHVPIKLSTCPTNEKTHWKQTIFYFEKDIKVHKGDSIDGNIAVKKNDKNHRALNIKIGIKHQSQSLIQYYQLT